MFFLDGTEDCPSFDSRRCKDSQYFPGSGGREDVSTFADLVQLACICRRQARIARNPEVADVLLQMADEYQEKAANLSDGEAPDMDEQVLDEERRKAARR
jgi:hypothetical protein